MDEERRTTETRVGIVGAGPAGLMLSHLLHRAGIENVVVEKRTPDDIANTHRAGILEAGTVRMLTESGVDGRVLSEGHEHRGTVLRFEGVSHRIDFQDLVGESVWLYPQNEVFVDLAAARERDGGDVRYGVTDTRLVDLTTDRPGILCTTVDGEHVEIRCEILVGADGSRGVSRRLIPEDARTDNFIEYPFAWFGILCEAPSSAPELIYANSQHGFALISQRSDNVQRMYFQCDPSENVDDWDDDRIWSELQRRIDGPDGLQLQRGRIFDKTVLPFRSYVCEPLRYGNLFLVGDAGHTVPPTGAKGLNLAFCDVRVLAPAIIDHFTTGDDAGLAGYSATALERIWKAQNFSYWATQLMHTRPGENPFEQKRRRGEFQSITNSERGAAYFAECYTGWPDR